MWPPHVAAPALSEWLADPAWLAKPAMTEGPSVTAASVECNGVCYLAHQSRQGLFYTYQGQEEAGKAAPYTTFLRVFRNWRHTLRFLKATEHSKCPDCEHFKALNRQATARSDQDAVMDAYRQHLAAQYAGRAVGAPLPVRQGVRPW